MYILGFILLAALGAGKLAPKIRLPAITGYFIVGLLAGPSVFNFITETSVAQMSIVSSIVLSLIAFKIGAECSIANIRQLGSRIIFLSLILTAFTVVTVTLFMYLLVGLDIISSLLLAIVAAAAAPTATMLLVQEYKAHGPLINTLIPVVAIGDLTCILLVGIVISLAKAFAGTHSSSLVMVVVPIAQILGSLVLGVVMGILFALVNNKLKNDNETLSAILGCVFITFGLSLLGGLSSLLACIALGSVIATLIGNSRRIFSLTHTFAGPLYLVFFTIAGASLQLGQVLNLGYAGLVYIVARIIGKVGGASLGARVTGFSGVIGKYLGISLLPQAGVAIGLATIIATELPQFEELATLILGSLVVFQLLGPILVRIAFTRAHAIDGVSKSMNRSQVS